MDVPFVRIVDETAALLAVDIREVEGECKH